MLHKNIPLGDIHYIHNWEVANATELADLIPTAADRGKLAWQLDTNEFFFLASASPITWVGAIGIGGPAGPGVPTGGDTGQILTKVSATNYDTEWAEATGAGTTVSATAPSTPSNGQGWLDSTTGILYTWVDDGDSSAWVAMSEEGNSIGAVVTASAPSAAPVGFLWFDTNTGTTYINIGTTEAPLWVEGGPAAPKPAGKELLTADRTYYVATTGNDSNDGLTIGAPFLTIQKAVDIISGTLDLGVYNVIIQLANGTYTSVTSLKKVIGAGNILIQGNTVSPTAVSISTTSSECFAAINAGSSWYVAYMKLKTTTSGFCLVSKGSSILNLGAGITFESSAQGHMYAAEAGTIVGAGVTYNVTGGSVVHLQAIGLSYINLWGGSIIFTNTPAWSVSFIYATLNSAIFIAARVFTGSCTGARYNISTGTMIDTSGAGLSFLPGNAAGTTYSNAYYA